MKQSNVVTGYWMVRLVTLLRHVWQGMGDQDKVCCHRTYQWRKEVPEKTGEKKEMQDAILQHSTRQLVPGKLENAAATERRIDLDLDLDDS